MGTPGHFDRWLPDPDTWDLPDRLSPDACRAETGVADPDPVWPDEEEEPR